LTSGTDAQGAADAARDCEASAAIGNRPVVDALAGIDIRGTVRPHGAVAVKLWSRSESETRAATHVCSDAAT
jgi:hypothetical protein